MFERTSFYLYQKFGFTRLQFGTKQYNLVKEIVNDRREMSGLPKDLQLQSDLLYMTTIKNLYLHRLNLEKRWKIKLARSVIAKFIVRIKN